MADLLRKCSFNLMAGCLMVVAAGCGPSGPDYQDVHGTITLDGTLLKHKSVFFAPEPGTPGMGAGAVTDAEGTYKLFAVAAGATRDVQGIQAGSYKVVVAEPMFPPAASTEEPTATDTPIGLPATNRKAPSQQVPLPYTKMDSTPLTIEVGKEGGEINFELRSRP